MTYSVKLLMIEKPVIYAVCYIKYRFIWYFEHHKDIDQEYNKIRSIDQGNDILCDRDMTEICATQTPSFVCQVCPFDFIY